MKIEKIKLIVNYLESHTWKQTALKYKISEMTISRALKKFRQVNTIKNDVLINMLKNKFNKLIRRDIFDMKASELRVLYYLLTDKNVSLRKDQYIPKIMKITGVEKWKKI